MKKLPTRNRLLELLPKGLVIAELGVFIGDFSKEILRICEPTVLYLVDTFPKAEVYSGDKDGENIITVPDLSLYYDILEERYIEVPQVTLIKDNSAHFLANVEWGYLDAVYIDADHSYESVYTDLSRAYAAMDGGYIMGHDYNQNGVKNAVDEFCYQNGLKISYLTEDKCPSYMIKL